MQDLMTLAADPTAWAALATLIVMEVVLGIDNLIFISILTNKLPEHQQAKARRIGIGLALVLRLALLGTIAIIVQLTQPVVTVLGKSFSWRDFILIAGDTLRRSAVQNVRRAALKLSQPLKKTQRSFPARPATASQNPGVDCRPLILYTRALSSSKTNLTRTVLPRAGMRVRGRNP